MVDCSELSVLINDVANNLISRDEFQNLDDVVNELLVMFPDLNRVGIEQAIVEANAREANEVTELQEKMRDIHRQTRTVVDLREDVKKADKLLEEGKTITSTRQQAHTTETIEQLRKTRTNLNKWLRNSDEAMKKRLTERLTKLQNKLATGDIGIEPKNRGKLHAELQSIQDEIDTEKSKITDQRKIESWLKKIDDLNTHLEEGTLPTVTRREFNDTPEIKELKNTVKELRKELAISEPAQIKKLEKSIAHYEAKLESGDILPKKRIKLPESEALEELIYKNELLKEEIRTRTYDMKPKTITENVIESANLTRAMMTTGEMSLTLRQGLAMIGHPIKLIEFTGKSLKALVDKDYARKLNYQIHNRDKAAFAHKSKLHMNSITGTVKFRDMEEQFLGHWIQKLPILREFAVAGNTYINLTRAYIFDMMSASIGKTGRLTAEEGEILANYVNVATGRGNLGKLEVAMPVMSNVFFSPRNMISRFQMLYLQPFWHKAGQGSGRVRIAIAKEYARTLLGLGLFYVLASLWGDIEDDPRSTDFMKIRIGKSRIDPLAGLSQVTVLMTRIITGKTKNAAGKIIPIRGEDAPYGETTVPEAMGRFLRGKLSPLVALPVDIAAGQNIVGDNMWTPESILKHTILPITWGDIYDAYKEQDIDEATAMSLLAFFGVGLQTYEDKNSNKKTYEKFSK